MDRWKAEQGRGREKRKIRRKKMQMREKVGKSRNTVFFQWFVAPEGRKVGPLKWRVRSQLARWEMKNCITKHTSFGPLLEVAMSKKCTPLWREAHFEVKMYKAHQVRTTFGSWDVEKVYAVVARSTFWSQNVFGPLLEVEMSKKRTPLWREAHFEVKMLKHQNVRATFGGSDGKSARRCGAKQISKSKWKSHFWRFGCWKSVRRCGAKHISRHFWKSKCTKVTTCSRHFWRFGCWKSARRCGAKHISKSKCTKYSSVGPLLEVEMSKKCTPLWRQNVQNTRGSDHFWRFRCRFASRHNTTEHTLRYTTLQYTTLHYTPVRSTTLNYTTPHYITLNDTAKGRDR